MDQIRDSFKKVKKDIFQLEEENFLLRKHLIETRELLSRLCDTVKKLEQRIDILHSQRDFFISTQNQTTDRQQTDNSTHLSTQNTLFRPLNDQINPVSIGNEGASTDRQQTDNRHFDTSTRDFMQENSPANEKKQDFGSFGAISKKFAQPPKNPLKEGKNDRLEQEIDSLEGSALEIKKNFENLTHQEFRVFITLADLEEKHGPVDYASLASSLSLTESSVRDYVQRLIKKGIPVEKTKTNNKSITLTVSRKLKKVVSLPTILNLRKDLE